MEKVVYFTYQMHLEYYSESAAFNSIVGINIQVQYSSGYPLLTSNDVVV